MASGTYYRVTPKPPPTRTFGFDKVERDRVIEIIDRLQKPTNSSAVSYDDKYIDPSNPPRARVYGKLVTLCPKSPDFSVSYAANGRPQSAVNRVDQFSIQRIFNRLQRGHTSSSAQRCLKIWNSESRERQEARDNPPTFQLGGRAKSAGARLQEEQEVRRGSIVSLVRHYEEAQKEKIAIGRLCRPTTASRMKQRFVCPFCSEDKPTTETFCNYCSVPPASQPVDEDAKRNDQSSKINCQTQRIQRLRQPTRASQGGTPLCTRLTVDPTANGLSTNSKDIPLMSGLNRTGNISEITNRLYRPNSSLIN